MLPVCFLKFLVLLVGAEMVRAYWLMGANNVLTTQRIDPIKNPGVVGPHVHDVLGGSNFGFNLTTEGLRRSKCSSIPILEDKSSYWYPRLYFWWANGSFTSIVGNPVMQVLFHVSRPPSFKLISVLTSEDYLYGNEPGETTAFPDDFRMISGDPTVRVFNPGSSAQQAITYICLDFSGKSEKFNELPLRRCPSGIRSQINFPSCWNGMDIDSVDHQSHVSFPSTGPDNGTCSSSKYPITLPRIFLEVYWYTQEFDLYRNRAMVPRQPFVFSNGDPIGYSFHADFYNGWETGVLQRALDGCNCNPYGDPACCVARGIFTMDQSKRCFVTDTLAEQAFGTLTQLPGANPVQKSCFEAFTDNVTPPILNPVFVHNGTTPTETGTISAPARTGSPTKQPRGTCIQNSAKCGIEPTRTLALWSIVMCLSFLTNI